MAIKRNCINDRFVWRDDGKTIAIYDSLDEKIYLTNKTGVEVFKQIISGKTPFRAARWLSKKYRISESTALKDITYILGNIYKVMGGGCCACPT